MENRTQSPLPEPRRLQTALCTLHAHSCEFHLVCVVFSLSVLRIHIIQTSYLHYIGFHQHNSYKCFLLHSCHLYGNPSQTQEDCKVTGRILGSGERARAHFFLLAQETPVWEEKGRPKPGATNPHLAASSLSTMKTQKPLQKTSLLTLHSICSSSKTAPSHQLGLEQMTRSTFE